MAEGHDNDVMPLCFPAGDPLGNVLDALGIGTDRSAAEFLNYQRHSLIQKVTVKRPYSKAMTDTKSKRRRRAKPVGISLMFYWNATCNSV
jgi:hypothetical protein